LLRLLLVPRVFGCCSFCLSSFIYPVIAHLIWSNTGLLSASARREILGTDGVLDNAGSMVVHVTGGVTALVGSWMVGPRIGRFDIDGKPIAMKNNSMVCLGISFTMSNFTLKLFFEPRGQSNRALGRALGGG
jgi:ammonia channel protein AmtB